MTSSIGLWAGFANVVVLLVLAAAAVSLRVSPLARLVIASCGFVWAWLTTVAFDATQAPKWTMVIGSAVIVVSIVVVIVTLHLWTQAGDGGESRPEPRGDDGGGGPRRDWPDAPPEGGEADASWWPEFEGRFAVYVAEHERRADDGAPVERSDDTDRGPSRRAEP